MMVHVGHGYAVGEDELRERRSQPQANGPLVVHLRDGQLPVEATHLRGHDVLLDG